MKHKPIKFLGILGVTTAVTLVGVEEAQAIIAVDTFDVTHEVQDNTANNGPATDTASGSSILGNNRQISLDATNVVGSTGPATIALDSSLIQDQGFGDRGILTLTYSFSALDVTQGGNKGFLFELNSASADGINFDVTLTEDDGDTSTASFTDTDFSDDVFLEFADGSTSADESFENNLSAFDFANVIGLELTISTTNNGGDFQADAIGFTPSKTTPVPFEAETSIALALLGGWGAWKRWKSRRTAANVN